jgi:hypothetical protein
MQIDTKGPFRRLHKFLRTGIVIAVILWSACSKEEPPAGEMMQKLGSLAVSNTNALSSQFWLRKGYSPTLGLSIRPETYTLSAMVSLDHALAKLRIAAELFETNALSSFYEGTVLLHGNMAMCRRWPSNWGASICGIEPLPYDWPHTNTGMAAVYRHGRDAFPVEGGQLIGNRHYRIRIRVLEPVPITNQVCFWIYLSRPRT